MDDRSAHPPPEPGPGEELRRVPEPARHQAARAARRQGALAVQAGRGHRGPAGAGGDAGVDPSGRRRLDGHVRDGARRGHHRGRARSLLLVLRRHLHRQLALHQPVGRGLVRGVRRCPAHRPIPLPVGSALRRRRRLGGHAGLCRLPRARRSRPGPHARVVVLERRALEGDDPGPDRGRPRRGRVLRADGVRADRGQRRRGPVDPRPAGRGAPGSRRDRGRHRPHPRRGVWRGRAAGEGVRQPRQRRVHPARPGQEHLPVRQGAQARLRPVPGVRRAGADPRRVHLGRSTARGSGGRSRGPTPAISSCWRGSSGTASAGAS